MDQVLELLGKVRKVLTSALAYIEQDASSQNMQKAAEKLESMGIRHTKSEALLEKISSMSDPAAIAELIAGELSDASDLSLFKTAEYQEERVPRKSQETWDNFINSI